MSKITDQSDQYYCSLVISKFYRKDWPAFSGGEYTSEVVRADNDKFAALLYVFQKNLILWLDEMIDDYKIIVNSKFAWDDSDSRLLLRTKDDYMLFKLTWL